MREVIFRSGPVGFTARLLATRTADVVWSALPLVSTAVFWGRLVRLDVPLEAYREPGASAEARLGDILFSPERDDILIPYGATPISRAGEIRLPSPCNLWARAVDDVACWREVDDGAPVAIERAGSASVLPTGRSGARKGAWRR